MTTETEPFLSTSQQFWLDHVRACDTSVTRIRHLPLNLRKRLINPTLSAAI